MNTPGIGLAFRQLSHTYDGQRRVLEGLDLEVPAGQFLALLGPSGCGKSTLLRLVAGLERPTQGQIEIDGAGDAAALSRQGEIAYVFQEPHLLPWRRVVDNVALPLELRGVSRDERRARAAEVLADVGLSDWLEHVPSQLSGGMRMRVSLARALVTRPRLLLLDEPFGALDELTRLRLDERLRDLWTERGPTVIFVTHSISEACWLAERVLLMSPRPARVVSDLQVELPSDRTRALRTTPAFGALTSELFAQLEGTEVSSS